MGNGVDQADRREGATAQLVLSGARMAAPEEIDPDIDVLACAAPQALAPRLRERAALPRVDADHVPVVERERRLRANQQLELCPRLALSRFGPYQQLVQRLVEQRREDLVLAAEVAIDRRPGDTCPGADLVHADGVESAFVEELRRRLEDLLVAPHRR